MKTTVTVLTAFMLFAGPMAFSDTASAGKRHHRHYAKHHFKHHNRHYARYPRYQRHHRSRIVVRFGYGGGCYNSCGC